MRFRLLVIGIAAVSLGGCAAETRHQGVATATWKQLTAEQKQMIIDQAYHQTMTQAVTVGAST